MLIRKHLREIFDADRRAREAEQLLLSEGTLEELGELLTEETRDALALEDEVEAEVRLVRLADLCAQVPGPAMVDALIAILDHPSAQVRVEAGEALRDVAYERFKEVARGIERALDSDRIGLAMQELPFVLTEIQEPDPVPLMLRFLQHADGNVVGAAIEALVDYGDPAAIPHLRRLVDDRREARLEELDDEPVPLGELARQALEELADDED